MTEGGQDRRKRQLWFLPLVLSIPAFFGWLGSGWGGALRWVLLASALGGMTFLPGIMVWLRGGEFDFYEEGDEGYGAAWGAAVQENALLFIASFFGVWLILDEFALGWVVYLAILVLLCKLWIEAGQRVSLTKERNDN